MTDHLPGGMMSKRIWIGTVVLATLQFAAARPNALENEAIWASICGQLRRDVAEAQRAAFIAETALPPVARCAPVPTGYADPPSVGGAGDVSVSLKVGYDRATNRLCYTGDKLPSAPVIRVRAGQRLTVGVQNTLRDPGPAHQRNCVIQTFVEGGACDPRPHPPSRPGADGAFYPIQAALPHPADGSTNLHVHGLLVPPRACSDEVLRSVIYPANFAGPTLPALPCQTSPSQLTYSYDLPADHPAGLYFYHTHVHGEAEAASMMGLVGAIVVENADDDARAALGVTDRVLVVGDHPRRQPSASAVVLPARPMRVRLAGVQQEADGADPRIDRANEAVCATGDPDSGGEEVTTLTLNGAEVPEAAQGGVVDDSRLLSTTMQPGQRQVWRILNAAADTYIAPRLVLSQNGTRRVLPLEVMARDGVRLTHGSGLPRLVSFDVVRQPLLLAPANRLEIVVHAPPAGGTLYLESDQVNPGCAGDGDPARRLLRVTAMGDAVPAGAADDSDIVGRVKVRDAVAPAGTTPAVRRTFALTEYGRDFTVAHTDFPQGGPKGNQFDPDATDFYITQIAASDGQAGQPGIVPFMDHTLTPQVTVHLNGAQSVTEEWTIENYTLEIHAFHIHQMHFRDVTGVEPATGRPLLDVINVPPAANLNGQPGTPGRVKLLMTFRRYQIGEFVYHCHVLEHEDNGMMGKVRVVAN